MSERHPDWHVAIDHQGVQVVSRLVTAKFLPTPLMTTDACRCSTRLRVARSGWRQRG